MAWEAADWEVVRPVRAESGVPSLEVQEDGSVFARGDQTKSDLYTLGFEGDFGGVTAIRLEALPDERLPAGGPGRTFYEGRKGDFFLSDFAVDVGGTEARIASGKENYGKLKFAHSITPIENPMKIKESRKLVARIETEIRVKELNEVAEASN